MPVVKNYEVRYFCETDNSFFTETQIDSVALPTECPNGHLNAVMRDLVILKETMEIS